MVFILLSVSFPCPLNSLACSTSEGQACPCRFLSPVTCMSDPPLPACHSLPSLWAAVHALSMPRENTSLLTVSQMILGMGATTRWLRGLCSSKGPRFSYLHLHWAAHKPPVILVLGTRRPLNSTDSCIAHCTHPHLFKNSWNPSPQ